MEITLMRHPHTVFHDGGQVLCAVNDPPITPYGELKLNNLIGMLPIGGPKKWQHVFSSNLQRALLPAREIASALRVGHTSYDWLNEVDWDPEFDGADYAEMRERFDRWLKADLYFDYLEGPGGATERLGTHRLRVKLGLDEWLDTLGCPDSYCGEPIYERVLVVSHQLTISNIISRLLGIKGLHHPFDLNFLSSVTLYRTSFGLWRVKI